MDHEANTYEHQCKSLWLFMYVNVAIYVAIQLCNLLYVSTYKMKSEIMIESTYNTFGDHINKIKT